MFSRPRYILGAPLVFISGIQTVPWRKTQKLFKKLLKSPALVCITGN